jgi:hypothetical protein
MKASLILAILASASAAAQAQETIKPGYWESTDKVLPPFTSTKVDRRCIQPKDVRKFMSCYINHHFTCDCSDQSYADGKISFHGACVDNKGMHVTIVGSGTYTPTTLNMSAQVVFKLAGIPIQGKATMDAHRLGDQCPPDPKASPAP